MGRLFTKKLTGCRCDFDATRDALCYLEGFDIRKDGVAEQLLVSEATVRGRLAAPRERIATGVGYDR